MTDSPPRVGVVLGSDSDLPHLDGALAMLARLEITHEVRILSAHRTPERAARYAEGAHAAGLRVLIAAAGCAAHLAGSLAARTVLPVIGVPIPAAPLQGLDALLATVQMPAGIPVATVAIGASGGTNAALLAAEILALADPALALRLEDLRREMARKVDEKDARVRAPHDHPAHDEPRLP